VLAGLLGAFDIDGLTLLVTASAGVALAPRHGADGPTLLRCADVAMYQAKRSGGGAAVYRPLADPHSRNRLGAATELKRAIAAGDIICHYQPQVDVATWVPVGVEALVRWSDPQRGLVPPEEFLGLAEQTGLMPALSEAVLRSALAEVRTWRRSVPHLRAAVNLSTGSLLDSRLPDRVGAELAAAGLPAEALVLEIADGALADAGRARVTLQRLHEMGVSVALDDYGTGRSSVVLLQQLPIDQLKLAGGLIEAVVADRRARAIVRHTVLMAHALQIQVVAKGVENAATLELVEEVGCDHAQGFLLAGPMAADALTVWLAGRPAPLPGRSAVRG
jgi:EAL domain-containing protein (putative c-di-GMP-specific phosphodiesterase class I)